MSTTFPESIAGRRAHRLRWASVRSAVLGAPARRKLQLGLGVLWLIDAALQYQPYMFTTDFVTQTIEPTASGAPWFVAHPTLWAAHLMVQHIAVYNAAFATVQLFIAAAIFFRPTVKIGLALSMLWSLGVWWLAEGIGMMTDGASPISGAPGAVILYAFIALLVWPAARTPTAHARRPPAVSVAERGPLGSLWPKLGWAALWLAFAQLLLIRSNRAPSGLYSLVIGTEDGEPAWVKAILGWVADPLRFHGTEVSIGLAVLVTAIALGIFLRGARRRVLAAAVAFGAVVWLAEAFGGIFTGQGTDVNSGPLLVLLALAYWPSRPSTSSGVDQA